MENEYTTSQEDLKNFKIVRNRGFLFALFLLIAEAVLYCITAGGVVERGFFKYITVVSCNIAISLIVVAISGAISHEIDNSIMKFHTKKLKQTHLDAVKKRWPVIIGYIFGFLNNVLGFASALDYARHYSKWWLWVITVIVLFTVIIGFVCQYWMLTEIKSEVKKAQNDIDHLIEMERINTYVEP